MSVSVLMYHHILPKSSFISSSVSEFEAQMSYLAHSGYKALSLNEFFLYKKGELKVPKKSVLITFDDGWRDNFYFAYPILKRYKLKACIFLVTSWIEKASQKSAEFRPSLHSECKKLVPSEPSCVLLNWDEIAQMSDICDFASHTHTHGDSYFGSYEFSKDLDLCKKTMKDRLNIDDSVLCWPRGKFDLQMLNIAKSAGYELFFTTKRGINRPDGICDDVRRIAIKNGARWLKKTLFIYQNDLFGALYGLFRKNS